MRDLLFNSHKDCQKKELKCKNAWEQSDIRLVKHNDDNDK